MLSFMAQYQFQKANLTADMLKDYIEKNKMTFDNPRQRGVVWSRQKKTALITSMIIGCPISVMYANRVDGIYDILDGKQRCTTITRFLSGQFKLGQAEPLAMPDGEVVDVSGRTFSDLPTEVQNQIAGYNLDFQYADNLTEEQQQDIIVRLNSGKPMSATELTKAQISSIDEVTKLAAHPLFDSIMNEDAKEASRNTSLVMQIYTVLFAEDKCLLNAKVRQMLSKRSISPEEQKVLTETMDFLLVAINDICKEKSDITKKIGIVFKRKVHFISMLYAANYALSINVPESVFASWLKNFFDAPVGQTSISQEYNDNIGKGTNNSTAVTNRLNAVEVNLSEYVKGTK